MALIKRSSKGTALTYAELDGNFTHLGGDGSYAFPSTDGSANQVLATNGNGQLSFVAQTGGGGNSGIALNDLSVTTDSASGSGSLTYNHGNGVFTFAPPDLSSFLTSVAINDVSDVTITNPANTEVLRYNGSAWVNSADNSIGFGSLSVVTSGSPAGSGALVYNNQNGAFTFTPPSLAFSNISGNVDLSSQVTGTLPVANMAATALTTVQTAANESAQLALTTQEGDVVVRTDQNKTYMRNSGTAGTMADFTLLATPTDAVTSVDGNTGAVTTLQLGTSSTTALAGNTTFAFADITSKPTTIAGYGINDALELGTSSTTALAGNTTFALNDLTDVTLSSSANTEVLRYNGSAWVNSADNSIELSSLSVVTSGSPSGSGSLAYSNTSGVFTFTQPDLSSYLTTVAFSDLTGKPTTISGYGITDALQLGTSSTTALAGNTVVDNLLLEIPKSSGSVSIGDKSFIKVAEVTIDARYEYYSAQLAAVGTGAAEGVANEKVVVIRVKQQAAMGSAPLVEVATYNNSNQDYDFGHVVAVNSGSETRVDIYFRADGPNSGAEIYKMADTVTASVSWSSAGNSYSTSAPTNFVQGGVYEKWHSGNQAGIFGSIDGVLKADGSGALSHGGLNDLSDVTLSSSANTEVLRYNGSAWVNSADNSIGLTNLSVVTAGTASGVGSLTYSNTSGVFTFTPADFSSYLTSVAINDVSDVTITNPANTQVLRYDGSGWVNSSDNSITLSSLSAIAANGASSSGGVTYSNTSGVFTYTKQKDLMPGSASDTQAIGSTTQTGLIALGQSTDTQTINIANGATAASKFNNVNIACNGATGGTKNVNIASLNVTGCTTNINMGNQSTSATSNITITGNTIIRNALSSNTIAIGGTGQTGTITLGQSTDSQTVDIASGQTANTKTNTINLGCNVTTGTKNINIGLATSNGTNNIKIGTNVSTSGLTNNIDIGGVCGTASSTINLYGTINLLPANNSTSVTVGGSAGTGPLKFGASTKSQTISISNAATENGFTNTINLGCSGVSGSTTNVNIASKNVTGATTNVSIGNQSTTSSSTIDIRGTALFNHGQLRCGPTTVVGGPRIHVSRYGGSSLSGVTPNASAAVFVDDSASSVIQMGSYWQGVSSIDFGRGANTSPSVTMDADLGAIGYSNYSNYLYLRAAGAERMRINSSGNMLIGTTAAGSFGSKLRVAGRIETSSGITATSNGSSFRNGGYYGGPTIECRSYTSYSSSAQSIIKFTNSTGSEYGSIKIVGAATQYNTSSDQRMKENIQDANDAGAKIDSIRIRQFDWKSEWGGAHTDYGVIAQELLPVAPEAVSEGYTEDEMMSVDYSKLVPTLIKEIQSLRRRVADLESN